MGAITKTNTFVGLYAAPFKRIDDVFLRAFYIAGLVGIFNAKDKITLVFFGE